MLYEFTESFKIECSPEKFLKTLKIANSKIDEMKKVAFTKVNKMNIDELEAFIK